MKFEVDAPSRQFSESQNKLERVFNVQGLPRASLFSLIAISLAACGGGGGSGSPSSRPPNDPDPVDPPTLPTVGNGLSLYKAGSAYQSTSFNGITLLNGEPHFQLEDASNDLYSVKLSAEGAGLLTFEFSDADDIMTLLNGTEISGFSQLKVVNGNIDATDADLGLIDYVTVASSIKLTASQVLDMENLIVASPSGGIDIEISSKSELSQIDNAVASGNLNFFSPGESVTFSASSGSSVTTSDLSTATDALNQKVKGLTSLNSSEFQTSFTFLAERSYATLAIENNDIFVNALEATNPINFLVNASEGYTVKSVKVGSVNLRKVNGVYKLDLSNSNLSDGRYQVVVELDNSSITNSSAVLDQYNQTAITLTSEIIIDRSMPGVPRVQIEGESNAINAFEAASSLDVQVLVGDGEQVDTITLNGTALAGSGQNFLLDAKDLEDGAYNLEIVVKDQAGNTSSFSNSFEIDADALQEPSITINNGDPLLGVSEASGTVEVQVALNGVAGIVSAQIGTISLEQLSNGSYAFDASSFAEGFHTITVISDDGLGEQLISEADFLIDRTIPATPEITISKVSGGLTAFERVEPVTVVIDVAAGTTIESAIVEAGGSLSLRTEGVYEMDARNLPSGVNTLVVTTRDEAGNELISEQDFTVVSYSSAVSQLFEFTTETSGDVVTFNAFVKNAPSSLPDGIPSFDLWIDLEDDKLDYVEGSFRAAPGAWYLTSENTSKGEVFATGLFLNPWNQYDEAFLSFDATRSSTLSSVEVSFVDLSLYTTEVGDISAVVII